ncbi:MAG: N-6 DNA methylase [Actinomycetota bacterium]
MAEVSALALVGLDEIATMAGVSLSAVTQWRKKKGGDFPDPLPGYESLVFDKNEVEAWLKKNRKTFKPLKLEATLWAAADKMRGHMDPSEYKHVALGLIFLKYISDSFNRRRNELLAQQSEGADPEDPDEYRAEQVFWVPQEARWDMIQASAKRPEIGKFIDEAMEAIERDNPSLKGVLPKDYARPVLDKRRLGELIDLISTIGLAEAGSNSRDLLGQVYEYFLGQFASKEGKKAGEFYTPRSIVRLLVEMIEPYNGRVYDPCCGSSGMFVQSEEFIRAHGGRLGDISIFGQESNPTTWRLANMNLAIRGIEANLGPQADDTFHNDLHPDLKADFILANPPFNMSDWGGDRLRDDVRWRYGTPPANSANFAWVQHMVHHLSPSGIAAFVLANGSMSSNTSGEGEIRKNMIEEDLVDCMVALPGQLFYGTQIPACLWFVARDKRNGKFRDRRGELLFIDARKLGTMIDRVHRDLTLDDTKEIARTYHAWRGEKDRGDYQDVAGFCRAVKLDEIRKHGHVLTPGRYVGIEEGQEDTEPFELALPRLLGELSDHFAKARALEEAITEGLGSIARDYTAN